MRIQKAASSRSAYLFVTLNLVLLLVFLIGGSSNLGRVQSTLLTYDRMLNSWFLLRLAIVQQDRPATVAGADISEYADFHTLMDEMMQSTAILAGAKLSMDLRRALDQTGVTWEALEREWAAGMPRLDGEASGENTFQLMETLQAHLFEAHHFLGEYVGTQERALSVLIYCLAATIVLVVVVFVLVEVESERSRRAALQTQMLAQHTMEAQEAERARIARGLHDSLAQELSLAAMEAGLLAAPDGRSSTDPAKTLGQLHDRITAAITWVRDLAYELRPAEIDGAGLAAAVTAYCEDRLKEGRLAFRWSVDPSVDSLSADQAINIYRIVQESVTNALRHANARELSLRLCRTDGAVELTVSDDGVGIGRQSGGLKGTRHGLGIVGMEERAQMLDATLRVTVGPNGGTTVHLSMPIEANPSPEKTG